MWTVLIILIVNLVSPLFAQQVVTSNGTSGQPCPRRRCLANRADCIGGQCVCRPPFVLDPHNGNFACYRPNQVFGEVKNDPRVRNFNNETADFPFPCRYLLTSTTTTLRIKKQDAGVCKCVLHAFNHKYRGKFFVGGFDFACQINNTILNEQLDFTARIDGIARNGVYTYTEHGKLEFLPDGEWTTTPVQVTRAGITVGSSFDPDNNQIRFTIIECGFTITFVAYDVEETRNQQQVPGIAFAVNCGLNPFFFEHDRVIATAPVKFGGTTYADLDSPSLSIADFLVIRGFTSGVAQNQPGGSDKCKTVGPVLNQCSPAERNSAAQGCFWILDSPRFIRCLDRFENATPVLALLEVCISFYCSQTSCSDFVTAVRATNCGAVSGIPELSNILRPDFCGV